MTHHSVSLLASPSDTDPLAALVARVVPGDVAASLELARSVAAVALAPGCGATRELWEILATLGATDLGAARAIEPHLDALAILRQAGLDSSIAGLVDPTWGVFAAEGGGDRLTATRSGDRWSLTGTKPWCSLADRLDCALVTAHLADAKEDGDERVLFAVRLGSSGVSVEPETWRARGLAEIPSGPVRFVNVEAEPVGESGWYLRRPGFAWGGIGVAACWYGGAVGIARTVYAAAGSLPEPFMAAHLGVIDEQLQSARRALAEAATIVDGEGDAATPSILAKRVRSTVARACEAVLVHAAHALGPAPLALDEDHAKRVADLELYLRQHHADKDDASLGSAVARWDSAPW